MRQIITLLFTLLALLGGQAMSEIIPVWSTGVAVPGEKVILYLVENKGTGEEQDFFSITKKPQTQNAHLELLRPQAGANPLDPNREIVEVCPIMLIPDKAGELKIADIEVEYQQSKRKATVAIPPLPVRPTSDIKWFNNPVPYGALWYTDIKDGYIYQPVQTSVKVFMPTDCSAPFPPQLQSVGVKASTFRRPVEGIVALIHSRIAPTPQAYAKGQTWNTADFMGELVPFREGNSDIASKMVIEQRLGLLSVASAELNLPVFTVGALPLPPGAPDDFSNTVGQYGISATTQAQWLAMNEATEVTITVRGTGNLEQLSCPKPDDALNWKLVPATRKPLLNFNGETIGMTYTQLMRPTAEVSGIPSFRFSYFDPQAMEYKTASTRPIPLPWKETDAAGSGLMGISQEPPPAGTVPTEELTDIYAFIPQEKTGASWDLPYWLWYLLYAPAILILAWTGVQAARRHLATKASDRQRDKELTAAAAAPTSIDFLKSIGAFIESRIPQSDRTPELEGILRRRDEEAFRPDAHPDVTKEERIAMLRHVRKALARIASKALMLALALLPMAQADPASQAYEEHQYTKALERLEQTDTRQMSDHERAVILYNIGNCQYRLDQPGKAALYYYRALGFSPFFPEAKANLAFIQRKEGAILPTPSGADKAFTLLNCRQLKTVTIACTALLACCIALLILRRGQKKPWLQASTAVAALLCLLCTVDWVYYATRETPDSSSLPPQDFACIITRTTAHTAADEASGKVIELPPSTPVHLLAQRGSWSYIETFTGTRGWIPKDTLSSL